jgi:TP901 family phage tail tape measure protein
MNIFDLQATISLNGDAFMNGVQNASTAFGSLGKTVGAGAVAVGNIVGGMVTSAASDLKGFGRDVIATGMDFDAAMSNVKAISGATGDEFEALRQKALEMGASTKFTATEAAEAFSYMAMAGWSASDMLDGIEGIMNLAAASGESLATTSDIVTDALTAFGLSASDSGHFADVLAAASASANTNVGMMGETFKYVAPVAGALNYSIEDVATAIGTMANSGVKASMAGTALRSALTALVKPSEDAWGVLQKLDLVAFADGAEDFEADLTLLEDEMHAVETKTDALAKAQEKYNAAVEKYGESSTQALTALSKVESATYNLQKAEAKLQSGKDEQMREEYQYTTLLQNSDGTMKDLSQTVDTLREAFANLDEKKQAEYASTLFGQRAMSGMLAIINSTEEEYGALAGTIGASSDAMDGAGAAAEMAQTQLDNLQGDVTILSSAFDGFKQAIFTNLEEPLRNLAQVGSGVFSDLTASIKEDGLGGALANLGTIINENLGPATDGLAEKFPLLTGAFRDFTSAFKGEVSAKDIDSFAGALGSMLNKFEENKPEIMNSIKGAFDAFIDGIEGGKAGKALKDAAKWTSELFGKFTDDLPGHIDDIRDSISEFFEAFNKTGQKNKSGSIPESLGRIASAFTEMGEIAFEELTPDMAEFLEVVSGEKKSDEISTTGGAVASIVDSILKLSLDTVADVTEGMSDFFGVVAKEGLNEELEPVVNEVVRLFGEFTTGTSKLIDDVTDSTFAFLDGTLQKSHVKEAISGLSKATGELLSHFSFETSGKIDGVKEAINDFLHSLGGSIVDTYITPVITGVQKFVEVLEKIASAADTAKAKIKDFLNLNDKISDVKIRNTQTGETYGLGDIAKNAFTTIGNGIKDGVQSAADGMWDFLTSDLDTQIGKVKDKLGMHSPSKVFAGIGKNIVLGLETGWESEYGGLEQTIERDMNGLTKTAQIGFDASAIGKSSAAGISSMLAASEFGGGRSGEPVEINLVLDGDVAATALYDPLRRVAWQKGRGTEELAYA